MMLILVHRFFLVDMAVLRIKLLEVYFYGIC
jgi:hypothetical protein